MYVDRSNWGHIRITGDDRVRFLHGLSTVNVETLEAGPPRWGALLSPKGRVLSVVAVERADDHLTVWCEGPLADTTLSHLDRHAVMDDVEFTQLHGPAYSEWTDAASVWTAPMIVGPAPGPMATAEQEHALRVEAGFPLYGVDISDENFPFETSLTELLDYTKGCYIGQEPVFRVHSQGKTAKSLRGLQLPPGAVVAPGDVVAHPEKSEAGRVTSVAVSPRLGNIALAYLHRTASTLGDTVSVGGAEATVVALPFP